ncbi:MAG: DUF5131 family protein [Sphingobacteriia bacterium]|nr:DUF5131 family protein [Sphingobacteriia bacterium]NCC41357.1 DUF5131 family protein [Gammaproteobacteria bacterium]
MNAIANISTSTHRLINVAELHPHPENPRIEPRQEIVDQLAAQMTAGMDPSHALIVRPRYAEDEGFEIISGHHRWLAAQQAGLSEVPCWVRDLSDADAYMQLVLCNTQSELHALEEGKHAADSGMDLKAYAEASGKAYKALYNKATAYRVASVSHVGIADIRDQWRNLAEIHAAPRWLWSALVAEMTRSTWTVAVTRERVAAFKSIGECLPWMNQSAIAEALVAGLMKPSEIERMAATVRETKVRDEEPHHFLLGMIQDLDDKKPARLSDVQAIVAAYESDQAKHDAEIRAEAIAKQRAEEDAAKRTHGLRANCSLEQWKTLTEEDRAMLLSPLPGLGGTFNQQKNEAIEWAQWSWNPVTGCKHDCPYCYARDIALGERMKQSGIYPNGWEPTFRSNALNAPATTKVPKSAAADTRYRNVFTCSMADLFGRWVPSEWIDAVMSTVRDSPEWNFLFLTKFPQRLAEIDVPDNAWMGTTVDMQARVKNAEKAFEKVGGKVKWLSVEPMIEPLRFERLDLFDWVVIGGASSSKQTPEWRPPYRWIESLVRQCDDAKVPVYMKTNLGIANRIIELPFDAPIQRDPQQAPDAFNYLGHSSK